ncbi:MAG: hypothetical protein IKI84_08565 [Clostridia bacterium]|nr:hypothetical protein [Clostridia bacterium]
MKKILSSFLVIALLLGSCSAFADTVSWSTGSGFKASPSTFKTYFNTFCSASNYTFNWRDSTKTDGSYTVYTAKSTDSTFTIKMYVKNNKVHMVYGEASAYSSGAETMGSWLGAALMTSAYALYFCEHFNIPQDIIDGSMGELSSVVSKISSLGSYSESQLRSGIVLKGELCGYPYALELKVSGDGVSSLKIHINMYIVPSSGKITVE